MPIYKRRYTVGAATSVRASVFGVVLFGHSWHRRPCKVETAPQDSRWDVRFSRSCLKSDVTMMMICFVFTIV